MSELIPPRRDEIITPGGGMTQRFAEYLESISRIVNTQQDDISVISSESSQANQSILLINELLKKQEKVVITAIALTAKPFDIVICTNAVSIDVILEPNPIVGDIINIKRTDAIVVVKGTIDGQVDMNLNVAMYSAKLAYNGTDWSRV